MCCRIVVCVLCFWFYSVRVCVFAVVAFCNLLAASRLFVCICVCVCVLCVPVRDVSCVCCLSVRVCAACGFCLWWVWCDAVCCCCSCFYWDKCELFFFLFSLLLCMFSVLLHNSCSFVSPMIFWFLRVACVRRPSPSRPPACVCACLHCLPARDRRGRVTIFTLSLFAFNRFLTATTTVARVK